MNDVQVHMRYEYIQQSFLRHKIVWQIGETIVYLIIET